MTYDLAGNKKKKYKEIWLDEKLYNIPLRIEEEFCKQVNRGMIKDKKEMETILNFIKRSKLK